MEDLIRNEWVKVRVNSKEKEMLKKVSAEEGLTQSEWIRHKLRKEFEELNKKSIVK